MSSLPSIVIFTKKIQSTFIIFISILLLGSCGVNKDLMFKTPSDYKFDSFSNIDTLEYQISINDQLRFRLFTNDGFQLIDITGGGEGQNSTSGIFRESVVSYLVETDGKVKLPTLGRIKLTGMNVREAENYLQSKYQEYYRKPFVILTVINKRAVVSTGAGGTAKVITLENNNITLVEALALAGGIGERGNSSKIKVIRNGKEHKEVYNIDLSTIEGVSMGDMIIQANDIIYVEPVPRLAQELLTDILPIIALITSSITILTYLSIK